jgi:hypothetical protein
MITTTVLETQRAYGAIRRMNEYLRLGQDPAWKVATRLRNMRPVVEDFENIQLKLYIDAGWVQGAGGMQTELKPQAEGETAEAYAARADKFRTSNAALNEQIKELGKNPVEFDCEPLTLAMFVDPPNTPEEKKHRFNPNDLADLGPFLAE